MKKILSLTMFAFCSVLSLQATETEYNMFNASDVDASGWLWFDTQAKIDKYVGTINNNAYTVDTKGKLIQMVDADQTPDYPATTVSADYVGVGTDGTKGGAGFKKGAIMLQPASSSTATNGGSFIICMPSCSTYSINLSCESSVKVRLFDNYDAATTIDKYTIRNATYATIFKKLCSPGNYTWTGIEKLTNGTTTATIQSDKPIYVMVTSCTKDTVYIHGVKVTTPTETSAGIHQVAIDANAPLSVYSIDGKLIGSKSDALEKGLYIIRQGEKSKKVAVE